MGHLSTLYGKIVGSRFNYGGNVNLNNDPYLLHKLNRLALDQLPVEDDYPALTRQMFNTPGLRPGNGLYKNQIIVFGASFKEIEPDFLNWIVKFENILRQLYWDEAVLHLETDLRGTRTYRWLNKNEPAFTANMSNTSDNWELSGDDRAEFENDT